MKLFFDKNFLLCILFDYLLISFSKSTFDSETKSKSADSIIRLGGLFPVGHFKEECKNLVSKINTVRGIQRVEAMLYAVGIINNNDNILRNVFLNVNLINTCDDPQTALEEIIKSFASPTTRAVYEEPSCKIKLGGKKNVHGYIGASTSRVSKHVARLLRLFKIPQISYASTSADLDNREFYPFFLRTVPPDQYQVQAISDLCERLKWSSVVVIYSQGDYGQVAFEHFKKISKTICIAKSYKLEVQSENVTKIITELKKHFTETRVIILFCTFQHFKTLSSQSELDGYIFVIGEIYGFQNASEGKYLLSNMRKGSIIMSMKSHNETLAKFEEYFNGLTPKNQETRTLQNKWFTPYWEEKYNCTLDKCPEKNPEYIKVQDDKIPYVIDAVYAFANAIDIIYRESCPKQLGICEKMKKLDTERLLEELLNSTYKGVFGNNTHFDENGNMNHGYDISIYKNGKFENLGTWYNASLKLKNPHFIKIKSYCSTNCKDGFSKLHLINQPRCCFKCIKCGENQVSSEDHGGCIVCGNGTRPNKKRNGCISLPILYPNRQWVIVVCVLAGLGSLLTIICALIFYYHKDNDFIIASAPELSYPLLLGIFLSYILTFFIIADQTTYFCAIRRFGLGFSFSLSYSSLLTKTIRLNRVFNIDRPIGTPPPKFIDTPSQLFILFALVAIQCSLGLIGLFLETPELGLVEEDHHNIVICKMPLYDIVTSYGYNFLLLCLCAKYTFQTRKVPTCFNEARYIGFAMYTTLVIWVSFLPAYIVDISKSSETIALCMNVVLHATSLLSCVFGPKVYMIAFRWERTQRKSSLHSFTQNYCLENDYVVPRKMTSQSLYSEITKLRSMSRVSLSK